MNVEIGTEAPIFLFWEYLFQIFGILSLQCGSKHVTFLEADRLVYSGLLGAVRSHVQARPAARQSFSYM
jgi:hypothetical protein